MEKIVQPEKVRKKRWLHRKPIHFEVRIVPPEAYPDLANNPTNPFISMSDEERIEELTDILGLLWADTCLEESKRNADVLAMEDFSCKSIKNKYDVTHPNLSRGRNGQKVSKME